jgi:hypothetical protein
MPPKKRARKESGYVEFSPLEVVSELDLDSPLMSSERFSLGSPGTWSPAWSTRRFSLGSPEAWSTRSPGSSTSSSSSDSLALVPKSSKCKHRQQRIVAQVRSLVHYAGQYVSPYSMVSPCRMLSMPSQREGLIHGSRVTGAIFGYRRGHVHFALQ